MAIINNNVQNVKFLRNQDVNITRDAAISLLNAHKGDAADGTALLARYSTVESGTTVIKTIVGFVYVTGEKHDITIFDTEGASGDVEKLRQEINAKLGEGITSDNTATEQLAALSGNSATDTSATTSVEGAKKYAYDLLGTLDYTDTAETGSYVSEVNQVDGKISVTRVALPSVNAISESGKAITAVSESNGEISATAGTIDAQYVGINDAAGKFSATTVEAALAELDDKIDGLDYTDTAVTGNYVSKVDEVNGVISVTREPLPSKTDNAIAKNFVKSVSESLGEITVERGSISSSAQTIVLTDNEDGGVNFEVNIDNETIIQDGTSKKLKVASAALTQYVGDENTIHISDVDSSTNTKTISSLLEIVKVTTGLSEEVKEEYHLVGEDNVTIGDPVKIYKDSHIVSITYQDDPNQEHYQNLIYTYLDASGATQVAYVDISELVLEAEFASGVTVTNHVAHGVVDPTSEPFLTVGADGFKLSGVQDAIDTAVANLDSTVSNSGNSGHVGVEIVEENGKLVSVTVSEDDLASADDLAELSAKTITEISSTNSSIDISTANTADGTVEVDVITDASKIKMSGFTADGSGFTAITEDTSVKDAVKVVESAFTEAERVTAAALADLDGRLDVVEDEYISGVSVNGKAVTLTNKVAPLAITSAPASSTQSSPITVTTAEGGAVTLTFDSIDCGYYS
jgi:hypothetical protein